MPGPGERGGQQRPGGGERRVKRPADVGLRRQKPAQAVVQLPEPQGQRPRTAAPSVGAVLLCCILRAGPRQGRRRRPPPARGRKGLLWPPARGPPRSPGTVRPTSWYPSQNLLATQPEVQCLCGSADHPKAGRPAAPDSRAAGLVVQRSHAVSTWALTLTADSYGRLLTAGPAQGQGAGSRQGAQHQRDACCSDSGNCHRLPRGTLIRCT